MSGSLSLSLSSWSVAAGPLVAVIRVLSQLTADTIQFLEISGSGVGAVLSKHLENQNSLSFVRLFSLRPSGTLKLTVIELRPFNLLIRHSVVN